MVFVVKIQTKNDEENFYWNKIITRESTKTIFTNNPSVLQRLNREWNLL